MDKAKWDEAKFDAWKKSLVLKIEDDLYEEVGQLAIKYNWPLGDSDPLAIIVEDYYYCLGDPSSTLAEMVETKTTRHKVVWSEAHAADYEKVRLDGQNYYINV